MTMKNVPKYTVIKDTREKDGYFFKEYDRCDGMVVETMKTGDYTLKGMENVLCIEAQGHHLRNSHELRQKEEAVSG